MKNKNIIGFVFSFIFSLFSAFSSLASVGFGIEDVFGEEIWMGWTIFESGNAGYAQVGGDGGKAYGRYQMDYRYCLPDFLNYAVAADPVKYSMLTKFTEYSAGDEKLKKGQGLELAWMKAYQADPEGFSDLQDQFMYENYYLPGKAALKRKGIDLDEIGDPVLNGTVYSLSVRDGADEDGVRAAWQSLSPELTIQQWLAKIYELETTRHPDQSNRWNNEQKVAALSGGITTSSGFVGNMMASDGSMQMDYVAQWMNQYPEICKEFSKTGWNSDNKEWARALRGYSDPTMNKQDGPYEIDFFYEYKITGGELQFAGATSFGISISGDAAAELFEIPDNGSSMPIVYYSQGGAPWSGNPFGDANIGSSGCSITSAAMVFSYLIGGVNKDKWISPEDIRQSIISKYGNYNRFHIKGQGQGWDIFPSIAGIYGLKCNTIGSGSITAELAKGHPIIMSCNPSEFTSGGHFIVLTGLSEDGNYVYVNDPNGKHAAYSYKLYTAKYLASCGKGWWSFSK